MPACPRCQQPLKQVTQSPYSPLNSDQFDASKAGDWFCECSDNGRGAAPYVYFWDHEVTPQVTPQVIPDFTVEDVRHRLTVIEARELEANRMGCRQAAWELSGYAQALEWVINCMENKNESTDSETNGR